MDMCGNKMAPQATKPVGPWKLGTNPAP